MVDKDAQSKTTNGALHPRICRCLSCMGKPLAAGMSDEEQRAISNARTKKRPSKWDARFADMQTAIDRRAEFIARAKNACGDVALLADMMAEAIDMQIEANGKEVIGRDGRMLVCMDEIAAAHCLVAARDAYRLARGSKVE